MQIAEAYNTIAEFGEKMHSPADFEYNDICSVLQKTVEALKEHKDLVKYVDSDFLQSLRTNYIKDYYPEYIDLFEQIMKVKNFAEKIEYLHEISDIKKTLRNTFETLAVAESPELVDEVFDLRFQRLKSEPPDSNMNLSLIKVIVSASTQEKCEALLKRTFSKEVPESYRNNEIQNITEVCEYFPQTTDMVFEIIKKHKYSEHYFSALTDITLFDEYKAEEVLSLMHRRIQDGPVDEKLLCEYYECMQEICAELPPKYKNLAQEFCREALLSPENGKKSRKAAAKLLENEELMYSQVSVGKRTEKNANNSYGYEKINSINPEEVCVLVIGGSATITDKEANGYAKSVYEVLRSHNLDKQVNVYGITYDFGEYFSITQAFEAQMKKYGHKIMHRPEFLENMHEDTKNPRFIEQIFNQFILPRISTMNGKAKISADDAARKMNKFKIVAHCLGGYAALKLEEMCLQTMQKLNYTPQDQEMIIGQMQVLALSPYCPLGVQKSEMFSVISAHDHKVKHNNYFEKYIKKQVSKGKILPLCYFEKKLGNFILVNRLHGEDNHNYSEFSNSDEHDYSGLMIQPYHSEKGKIAMTFAQNYLIKGLKSALKNEIRTSATPQLLVRTEDDLINFLDAEKNGKVLYKEMVDYTLCEQKKVFNKKQKD